MNRRTKSQPKPSPLVAALLAEAQRQHPGAIRPRAAALGIDASTLYRWECGKIPPQILALDAMAQALGGTIQLVVNRAP